MNIADSQQITGANRGMTGAGRGSFEEIAKRVMPVRAAFVPRTSRRSVHARPRTIRTSAEQVPVPRDLKVDSFRCDKNFPPIRWAYTNSHQNRPFTEGFSALYVKVN